MNAKTFVLLLVVAGSAGSARGVQLQPVEHPTTPAERQTRTAVEVRGDESRSRAEQERLAQERTYQQELTKQRAVEAKARAALDITLSTRDQAAKFHGLIEAAEQALAAAEFQTGIRLYNQAMTVKPVDMPVTGKMRELQAALQAQNKPVEIAVQSDGATWVSVRHARAPAQFAATKIKLLPGNYEVVGRRPGYRDVVVRIAVRCDLPPPAVRIVCTEQATP